MTAPLQSTLAKTRTASVALALLDPKVIDATLLKLADASINDAEKILEANRSDLERMDQTDLNYDRLQLTLERIKGIARDVRAVAALPSPLGLILEERTLANGLHLQKMSVPLGVIGMIYEARPNVTVDAFTLCFKAGNCCVLKGGSDARHSNEALVAIIRRVLKEQNLDPAIVTLLPPDRSSVEAMLTAHGLIDVLIPRGSQSLIDFVRERAQIPIIETGAGIVHTYVDESADAAKASAIIFNEKTRRPSVCNAIDTLLIHSTRLADLPAMLEPLEEADVELFADEASFATLEGHYDASLLHRAKPEHFGTEYLSLKMSIKTVENLEEALAHIARYSSKHSEAIVAEDQNICEEFLRRVDAAAVYANASTSFTDGAQFGLGAEIGISTQKLHARGPMGLKELTSEKWIVRGNGQVRE
ncbi:glutamate-5-semialdehyde dehydrogenase [Candidatus Peregrinibacteria bacterium]|nr:glutamate-5-semialdehyde dehydrogenase [Candidatus Peregrinibacteria bacterium]MBI3816537.1 glutamate-5-semialdehyde dehydrogenase [Candidatus Peregrinibacteria bacterium]